MAYKLSSCVVLVFQRVVLFILPQPSCPWSSSQERTLPSLSTDCQVRALTTTFMSTLCCYGNNCSVKWKGSLKFICSNFLWPFTHKISSITRHFYKKSTNRGKIAFVDSGTVLHYCIDQTCMLRFGLIWTFFRLTITWSLVKCKVQNDKNEDLFILNLTLCF